MAITELQRTKRQQTLGASDIPTIFGLNPWKSPADLWLEKTGRVEAPDAGEAAEIGDALEAGIKPLAERRLGVKLVKPTGTFVHENGIMSANVDLMAVKAQRGSSIVELKTTGAGSASPEAVDEPIIGELLRMKVTTEHLRWMKATIEAALKFGGEA